MSSGQLSDSDVRRPRKEIAEATLAAIKHGSYKLGNVTYDLEAHTKLAKQGTLFYAANSLLSSWSTVRTVSPSCPAVNISILEISTLEGARLLSQLAFPGVQRRIGVLNFASARKPGGGFLSGAQAQEESIARSSTLYPTLLTKNAQEFYAAHNRDPKDGYYSHAMIYSPKIVIFRDDQGSWTEPLEVDVLTSPAVNAGKVRTTLSVDASAAQQEARIETTMRERMSRILYLFEQQGVRDLVLGSFGTGVFRNKVDVVAKIWTDILTADSARFKTSFDNVVFAVLGRETYLAFHDAFQRRAN